MTAASDAAGLPAADPETVLARVLTILRHQGADARAFADDAKRPQDAVDYRAIAMLFDCLAADVDAGHYNAAVRSQAGTGEAAR